MIPSSACRPWQTDQPALAGARGGLRKIHHSVGHDRRAPRLGTQFGGLRWCRSLFHVPRQRRRIMGRSLSWWSDAEWDRIPPRLRTGRRGARRGDERRVICRIVHMLRAGARQRDCPAEYGPYTTAYTRFNRWSRQAAWEGVFHVLAGTSGSVGTTSADSAHIKAHRSASGAKGGLGQRHRPLSRRTDDQASRPDRRSRPPSGAEPDAGPGP